MKRGIRKPESDFRFYRLPAMASLGDSPSRREGCGHFVRFYEEDEALIAAVAAYIGGGLGAGEAAIVIATADHRSRLETRLRDQGIDIPSVLSRRQLRLFDARETLALFMADGMPVEGAFMEAMGSMVGAVLKERPGLRAFGEMVALLWKDGNGEAAVRLEELWNQLASLHRFSLLCAYPIKDFSDHSHGDVFDRICREHQHVMAAESYREDASREERGRAVALLQQKANALDTERAEKIRMEASVRNAIGIMEESERRFRSMADSAPVLMWMTGTDGRITYVNRPLLEFTGRTMDGEFEKGWAEIVHPEDFRKTLEARGKAEDARAGFRLEYRIRRFDGAYRWVLDTGSPRLAPDGSFMGFIGSCIDVSDLKDAEDQLRQAQKMEAVGRLAGGIAHDFNNLLTAINGYSEMALGLVDQDDFLKEYLREIKRSGERAASLTHQLLAYSRKQILAPAVFDLNETVRDMDRMLRRLIGEHIDLKSILQPDLGLVKADPGQVQQIILNLVLNARDAMPDGGSLTFETANVILEKNLSENASTPHVMLTVRDTGTGMPADVKTRIFEPFFTTKEVGKGTGLGLSSVYGIIKQSGGLISVESEVGRGSAFKVCLPMAESTGQAVETGRSGPGKTDGREAGSILLVEDEDTVRKFIMRTLASKGYTVLEAKDGDSALALSAQCGKLHLLLTDVVMPNMNGASLAERLKASHPAIRVLFMSGYTENIFHPDGIIDPEAKFLQKPFSQSDLLDKVKELLETGKSAGNP